MSGEPSTRRICPHCETELPPEDPGAERCPSCGERLRLPPHLIARPGRSRRARLRERPTKPIGGPRGAEAPAPDATPPAATAAPLTPPSSPAEDVRSEEPMATAGATERADEDEPHTDALAFGDYWLLGEISRGGSGVLYRARARGEDRLLALRILQIAPGLDPRWLESLESRHEAVLGLSHPVLVPVLDIGEHMGSPFLVQPLVTAERLIGPARADGLPVRSALRIVAAMARALHHAHAAGIVHGNIEPSKILIDADGAPLLLDIGLPRSLLPGALRGGEESDLAGAHAYLSPEQVRGEAERVDARSDVFSLGAVLHHLLAGAPPFRAPTMGETLARILERPTPHLRSDREDVDADLDAIQTKALAKDPADRYPTAGAFADDLERYLAGEDVWAELPSGLERASSGLDRIRRPLFAVLAMLLLLVAAGTFGRRILSDPAVSVRDELASPDPGIRAATLHTLFEEIDHRATQRRQDVLLAIGLDALEDPAEIVRVVTLRGLVGLPAARNPTHPLRTALAGHVAESLEPTRGEAELEAALEAAETLRLRSAEEAVVTLAASDAPPEVVRARALEIIGELGFVDGFETLMSAFAEGGRPREVASDALTSLTQLLLHDPSSSGDAGSQGAPAVRRRGGSPDNDSAIILAVLEGLGGMIGADEIEDPVVTAIRHGGERARLAAVWALYHTGDPRGATLLVDALSDPYEVVGRAAAEALTPYGGPRLERQLAGLLSSPQPSARANAAIAVGELRMRGPALNALYKSVHREPEPAARAVMAQALGRIGQVESVPYVLRLLDDDSPEVRDAAHAALVALTDEDLGAERAAWQDWWDQRG